MSTWTCHEVYFNKDMENKELVQNTMKFHQQNYLLRSLDEWGTELRKYFYFVQNCSVLIEMFSLKSHCVKINNTHIQKVYFGYDQ